MKLLVLGEPGSGKTTWCREYVDWWQKRGSSVGGVLSPATTRQDRRTGFNVIDLLTGEEVAFARLSARGSSRTEEKVGAYIISRQAVLFACAAVKRAVDNQCDLVVIDEVGPLELSGKGLMPAVRLALASPTTVLMVVRSSLREAVESHFPEYEFIVAADLTQSWSNASAPANCRSPESVPNQSSAEGCLTQRHR